MIRNNDELPIKETADLISHSWKQNSFSDYFVAGSPTSRRVGDLKHCILAQWKSFKMTERFFLQNTFVAYLEQHTQNKAFISDGWGSVQSLNEDN